MNLFREAINSFPLFLILSAIAFGIMFLVIKKDSRPYPKSARR